MDDILAKILEQKKKDVEILKSEHGIINLKNRKKEILSFEKEFAQNSRINIIAEIKPASPSEGIIISNDRIEEIAEIYNETDIAAISVLTDEHFFNGSFNNLKRVSAVTEKPLLCKDFIIDKYQIELAYINNADAVLLIVEALNREKLYELYNYAVSLGLGVLVEFHYAENADIINNSDFRVVGINNRNLKTMEVSIDNSIKLKKLLSNAGSVISESGIYKKEDLIKLELEGFSGALIGTSILKSGNIKEKLNELVYYKEN